MGKQLAIRIREELEKMDLHPTPKKKDYKIIIILLILIGIQFGVLFKLSEVSSNILELQKRNTVEELRTP